MARKRKQLKGDSANPPSQKLPSGKRRRYVMDTDPTRFVGHMTEDMLDADGLPSPDRDPKVVNICRTCSIRLLFNGPQIPAKRTFMELYKDPETAGSAESVDPDWQLIADHVPSVDDKIRPILANCCYLCYGLLQTYTLEAILSKIGRLTGEYQFSGGVVLTSSHLVPMIIRSYLCGVGGCMLPVRLVFKWLLMDMLPKKLNVPYVPYGTFKDVTVDLTVEIDHSEYLWATNKPFPFSIFNFDQQKFKPLHLAKALENATSQSIFSNRKPPGSGYNMSISVQRLPMYLGGRYTKMSRFISQSPWFVEDETAMQMVQTSVEECVFNPVADVFGAGQVKMHAAGREDIDVRMMGEGRPFYLKISDFKKEPTLEELEEIRVKINARNRQVQCPVLTFITSKDVDLVKNAQVDKEKMYVCVIKTETELTDEMLQTLNEIRDLVLHQKTPLRVLHRRAPLTRPKRISSVEARRLTLDEVQYAAHYNDQITCDDVEGLAKRLFVARIVSEGGSYIKEFVHGDFNRTLPHMGTLLNNRCDILQLDVENVSMEWPPVSSPGYPWGPDTPSSSTSVVKEEEEEEEEKEEGGEEEEEEDVKTPQDDSSHREMEAGVSGEVQVKMEMEEE